MSALEDAILNAVESGPDPDAEKKRGGLEDDGSDSEGEGNFSNSETGGFSKPNESQHGAFERMPTGFDKATGPKGVLADYKKFKEYVKEQEKLETAKRTAQMNRFAMTGRTLNSDGQEEEEFDEDDLLEDEQFMKEYSQKRLEELRQGFKQLPKFGFIKEVNASQYVDAIDKEDPAVHVVIHLYDQFQTTCYLMNQVLSLLAKKHPYVKFLKVVAKSVSDKFGEESLPTILVYKAGDLVGNFIKITDTIGDDFTVSEMEYFLAEKKFLIPELAVPLDTGNDSNRFNIKAASKRVVNTNDDDDDDDDFDD